MNALSGVRRVWSGARSVPEPPSPPAAGPRLRVAGGRIGLVVPPQVRAPADDPADAVDAALPRPGDDPDRGA
ncbi:hypothetical protein ACFQ9U_00640 [Streptomyces sp. NPDC056568]|uniref:hypothetical protein n=1 Tax=Streptomyces sp. NPDC056568 TaxID=3345866 RepID=UPI0036971EDC